MTARSVVVCAALALGACSRAPALQAPAGPPNVLIVTIDTLRADRLGIYGAFRQGSGPSANVATPNMDRLAREGAWAPQADVHVPLTRPAHVSLLSERCKSAGFATGAFVSSVVLEHQSGLARGFDRYSDEMPAGADRRPGDQVVADALGWLRDKSRFFAWVHLYDPHA